MGVILQLVPAHKSDNVKSMPGINRSICLEERQDKEMLEGISFILMDFFGYKWYQNKNESDIFTNVFLSMWDKIVKKQDEILKKFKENNFTKGTLTLNRIKKGSQAPLDLMMS